MTSNHANIHKKVGVIMGGRTLDILEVRIYHKGKNEGRAEGRAEGEAERKLLKSERDTLEAEVIRLKRELEILKQHMK